MTTSNGRPSLEGRFDACEQLGDVFLLVVAGDDQRQVGALHWRSGWGSTWSVERVTWNKSLCRGPPRGINLFHVTRLHVPSVFSTVFVFSASRAISVHARWARWNETRPRAAAGEDVGEVVGVFGDSFGGDQRGPDEEEERVAGAEPGEGGGQREGERDVAGGHGEVRLVEEAADAAGEGVEFEARQAVPADGAVSADGPLEDPVAAAEQDGQEGDGDGLEAQGWRMNRAAVTTIVNAKWPGQRMIRGRVWFFRSHRSTPASWMMRTRVASKKRKAATAARSSAAAAVMRLGRGSASADASLRSA